MRVQRDWSIWFQPKLAVPVATRQQESEISQGLHFQGSQPGWGKGMKTVRDDPVTPKAVSQDQVTLSVPVISPSVFNLADNFPHAGLTSSSETKTVVSCHLLQGPEVKWEGQVGEDKVIAQLSDGSLKRRKRHTYLSLDLLGVGSEGDELG